MRGLFGLIAVSNICSANADRVSHYAYQPYIDKSENPEEYQRMADKYRLSWDKEYLTYTMPDVGLMEDGLQKFLPIRQRKKGTLAGHVQALTGLVHTGGYMEVQLAFAGEGQDSKFTYPATYTDFLELRQKFEDELITIKKELHDKVPESQEQNHRDKIGELQVVSAIDVNERFPNIRAGRHSRAKKLRGWLQSMLGSSNRRKDKKHGWVTMEHLDKDWNTLKRLKIVFEDWFIGLERYYQPGQKGMEEIRNRMMSKGQFFSASPYHGKTPQKFDFF